MFNNFLNLGNLVGLYSGSPLLAAVSSATGSSSVIFPEALLSFLDQFFIGLVLIGLALCVLMILSWWKVFEKAERRGWAALVPIYNNVVMLQIVGMSPWLVLLVFVPFVGQLALFIVMIFMNLKLAKAFGKEEGFAIGLILLPIVFVPILAFGQARFGGVAPIVSATPSDPVPPQNPTATPTITPTTPVDSQNSPTPPAGPTGTI